MSNRIKNIFIFIIMVLLIAGVYLWFYPLNKGEIIITTGISDYIVLEKEEPIICPQDPCTISLNAGSYKLKIQKENYQSKTINIDIKRGKTDEIFVELRKIPNLIISQIIPQDPESKIPKELPEQLRELPLLSPTWDQTEKKLVFLDLKDNKLKIWEENRDLKTITTLKYIEEGFKLNWSPDQTYILGSLGDEIYFIDTKKASRKKHVLDFSLQNTLWSLRSDYLLANDEKNELYKINFAQETVKPLEMNLDLKNAIWSGDDLLIFFSYDAEEGKTMIESYNFSTQEKEEIITKFNFSINKISSDANNVIYFYNPDMESWYYLNY